MVDVASSQAKVLPLVILSLLSQPLSQPQQPQGYRLLSSNVLETMGSDLPFQELVIHKLVSATATAFLFLGSPVPLALRKSLWPGVKEVEFGPTRKVLQSRTRQSSAARCEDASG